MVNSKYIFNVHWPNSAGLVEGFCTVCEQPWVDLNPRSFALKATTLTTSFCAFAFKYVLFFWKNPTAVYVSE